MKYATLSALVLASAVLFGGAAITDGDEHATVGRFVHVTGERIADVRDGHQHTAVGRFAHRPAQLIRVPGRYRPLTFEDFDCVRGKPCSQ